MATTLLTPEIAVFTGLRAWILSALPAGTEVIQELDNRVPMPAGGFVLMNCLNRHPIEWPSVSWDDTATVSAMTIKRPVDFAIQLDAYGPDSADWVTALDTLWMSASTCDALEPYGMDPLYNEDPRQIPFIDGEHQYEHRWCMTVHLQYNPAVSVDMQFATEAEVTLVNVEATYPT